MRDKSIKTADKLDEARRLYLQHPSGITDSQMAKLLDVSRRTANRYRLTLKAYETRQNSYKYTLTPTHEDVEFAVIVLQRMGVTQVPMLDSDPFPDMDSIFKEDPGPYSPVETFDGVENNLA